MRAGALLLLGAAAASAAEQQLVGAQVFSCRVGAAAANQQLIVNGDGSYNVLARGAVWLGNGTVAAHVGGSWRGPANGLQLTSGNPSSGSDPALGPFTAYTFGWKSTGSDGTALTTTFRCFSSSGSVHFETYWPGGAVGVNTSSVDADNVTGSCSPTTHFPSFDATSPGILAQQLAWALHGGPWTLYEFWGQGVANGFRSCSVGPLYLMNPTYAPATSAPAGSPTKPDTMVLSPTDHFHATLVDVTTDPLQPGSSAKRLVWGLMSSVLDIPAGYSSSVALLGGVGLHETTYAWGRTLRAMHNTSRINNPQRNALTTKLSYWTDNGAVYFQSWWDKNCSRNCSSTPGAVNAEDTLLGISQYHKDLGLPVGVTQLDTWWFYQQADVNKTGLGGSLDCAQWMPRDDLFPHGLPWLTAQLPLILYSWGFITPQDGNQMTNYTWETSLIFNPSQPTTREGMVSLDQVYAFYSMIRDRFLAYGGTSFEEDNMGLHTLSYGSHITAVDGVERWWAGFASPWCESDIPVQICEAGPADVLESLKYGCVDNSRDNIDNVPCAEGADCGDLFAHRWHVGFDRMMLAALGLKPYQDNAWSNVQQPGSTWGVEEQAYPEMQWLLSVLSAGPVGFSDIIGNSNVSLLMTCCASDGALLQPSEPSSYIDALYLPQAVNPLNVSLSRVFQAPTYVPPSPEAAPRGVDAPTAAPYFSLLAVDVAPAWPLLPAYLSPDASLAATRARGASIVGYAALSWSRGFGGTASACAAGAPASGCLQPFDDTHPLTLDTGVGADRWHHAFELFSVSPISTCGWALIGEPAKAVRVSGKRFAAAAPSTGSSCSGGSPALTFSVWGAPSESLNVLVLAPGSAASPASGAAAISSGSMLFLALQLPSAGGLLNVTCSGAGASAACSF